jgi:hypothetical protein
VRGRTLGIGVIALAFAASAPAQETGTLRGSVVSASSREPVARASVSVLGDSSDTPVTGAMSGEDGTFFVRSVPAGARRLRVRGPGYETRMLDVRITAGDTTRLTIELTRSVQQLATVRTEARASEREDFEKRPQVSRITVSGESVSRFPVIGEPDVLRVVQLLPGVVAKNDYTAGYNVRGGESDQNLVLLDGIPVYNPFHLGGLFGTFIDETVGDFQLMAGGFPTTHGGRLSSVLDVTPAVEPRQGIHGGAGVSVLASHLALAGTLPGGRTSWSVAARRTYADRFVDLLSDRTLPYYFVDAQMTVRRTLARGGSLSFTTYAGSDILDADIADFGDSTQAGAGRFQFGWGNRLAGVTLRQPLAGGNWLTGDSAILVQRVSWTRFKTKLDLGEGSLVFANSIDEGRLYGSLERMQGAASLVSGYEYSQHHVRYAVDAEETGTPLFDLTQRPAAVSLFTDMTWRASDDVLIRGGLRGENVTGTGWSALSPRASVRWFATPDLALTVAAGQYTQWMHALRNDDAPIRIFDFWIGSDRWVDVSTSQQAVVGLEQWLGGGGRDRSPRFVRVEGYAKSFSRLPEPDPADDPAIRGDEFLLANGHSYGVDVFIRQLESERLSGWIAYSWSVSSRVREGQRYFPVHDRRHNVNAVATWRANARYLFGLRVGYGTGLPYTSIVGQIVRRFYDPYNNTWDTGVIDRFREPVGGTRNGTRYPSFQRLDLSVTRTSTWRGVSIRPYFSLINATNQRNVFTYVFDYTDNPPTRTAISQFPFLPTVGVTASW